MAAYGTAAGLRSRINKTDTADDTILDALLDAASKAIDRYTNHDIGESGFYAFDASESATSRVYKGSGKTFQWIDECIEISTVAVKTSSTATAYTAWSASDWLAFTGSVRNPNFNDTPYTGVMTDPNGDQSIFTLGEVGTIDDYFSDLSVHSIRSSEERSRGVPTVQITAKWGATASPPDVIVECTYMIAARWWKRFESSMSDTLATGSFGQLLYTQAVDPDVGFILSNTRWMRPQVGARY